MADSKSAILASQKQERTNGDNSAAVPSKPSVTFAMDVMGNGDIPLQPVSDVSADGRRGSGGSVSKLQRNAPVGSSPANSPQQEVEVKGRFVVGKVNPAEPAVASSPAVQPRPSAPSAKSSSHNTNGDADSPGDVDIGDEPHESSRMMKKVRYVTC